MRLLIIDDDPAMREALERGLREERFLVEGVRDGAAAEERLQHTVYDVIVLDVVLPGQDGFTICRRLRSRGTDTPILLLTGRGAPADRVHGLNAGGDDYLAKPFVFDELVARIRALSRRGRTRQLSTELAYGEVRLDQRDHVARVNGAVVTMTATEFRLLEYLMLRAEALVTREELAQHVFGGGDSESNVINVYISNLRRKLGPAGAIVRTIRSAGYALRAEVD
jgi:DNA-binding response OmpR family regulator